MLVGFNDHAPQLLDSLHDVDMPNEPISGLGESPFVCRAGEVDVSLNGHVLRGFDTGDRLWMHTLPSPSTDLLCTAEGVWLAQPEELLLFGGDGAILKRLPIAAQDLALAESGVLALTNTELLQIQPDAEPVVLQQLRFKAVIGADGAIGNREVEAILWGRFGSDGTKRAIIRRKDNAIVMIDTAGEIAAIFETNHSSQMLAYDDDGDGKDELILAFPGRGLAVFAAEIP